MDEVEVKVRAGGPYKLTGPVRIVDAEGREIPTPQDGKPIVLCRCGGSSTKPFCDGSHRENGFAEGGGPGATA